MSFITEKYLRLRPDVPRTDTHYRQSTIAYDRPGEPTTPDRLLVTLWRPIDRVANGPARTERP